METATAYERLALHPDVLDACSVSGVAALSVIGAAVSSGWGSLVYFSDMGELLAIEIINFSI